MNASEGSSDLRRFTAEVASLVAAEHAFDPTGELLVWLHLALRREASVGEIYGTTNLARRLWTVRAPAAMVDLLRMVISNIWAQEKAHASFLEAVLGAVARDPGLWHRLGARLDGFLGSMEGQVLSGRTSPSPLQRAKAGIMLAIGRRVQDVPGFVASLSSLSFRDFCLLNAELEITAVHGYERMLTLLALMKDRPGLGEDTTLCVDVERMVHDERFHNLCFIAIGDWFDPADGNALRAELALEACAGEVRAIRAKVYGQ